MVTAVIMAGGRGQRLASRSQGLPKVLVPILGKPLLEYQMELLAGAGIKDVAVLTGFQAEAVARFCAGGGRWGMRVRCMPDREARGPAAALLAALPSLGPRLLVLNGDTMMNLDLRRFQAAHQISGAAASLLLHPNDHPFDSDLVELDRHGRILAFHPKPHKSAPPCNLVNAGVYLIETAALRRPFSSVPREFIPDLFAELMGAGVALYGYRSPEYVKDAGTPERLDQVAADLATGSIARASLTQSAPAIFLDRDGTLVENVPFLTSPDDLRLLHGVPQALKLLRAAGYRLVVVTNQSVIARGGCTEDNLIRIHNAMEIMLAASGAFLDAIYYCPHHPDFGFAGEVAELKRICDCRKPEIGLVRRAVADLNLDLAGSWFIGDSQVDMLCAARAGIRAIGVGSDKSRVERYSAQPDCYLPDLLSAANFIVARAGIACALSS